MTPTASTIYGILKESTRPIPIHVLAERFECGQREISRAIEELRDEAIPVISRTIEPAGVFLARSVAEFKPWFEQIDHRIQKMSHRRKIMKETLERMEQTEGQQVSLFCEEGIAT